MLVVSLDANEYDDLGYRDGGETAEPEGRLRVDCGEKVFSFVD